MDKILINGRFLTRKPTGVDRFAAELLRVIDGWVEGNDLAVSSLDFEVVIPTGGAVAWAPRSIQVRELGSLQGHLWEQVSLARYARGCLLLSLCNTGPILASGHLVAIHDATPVRVPDSFSLAFRSLYRVLMPLVGAAARRVITVSEFSKREIGTCYGISAAKIRIVPNSGEQLLRVKADRSIIERLSLRETPYVLAVATQARHKNMEVLLTLAERVRCDGIKVVLAGGANGRVFDTTDGNLPSNVVRAGFVSDGELRSLYENALCFVFPSLYEGFGIPPLEAMNVGCPVISSNTSALPEVLGDAAMYVAPRDVDALHDAVRSLRDDKGLVACMVEKGRQRAARFAWVSSARALVDACREVLAERGCS